jgi:copper chaperone CopZ
MSIEGVFSAQTDIEGHYAWVTYDGAMTSLQEIQGVLDKRGYPVQAYEFMNPN